MNENPYSDMDMEAYRVAYLIAGYIRNTLTEAEHEDLDDWVNASDHNMKLFEDLTDERNIEANLEWMDKVQSEQSFKMLRERGAFKKAAKKFKIHPAWIAAASVVLITVIYFLSRNSNNSEANTDKMTKLDTTGLQPGGNRAFLSLGDGSIIDLTTTKNGLMKNANGSDIIKVGDGALLYEPDTTTEPLSAMHTLTTPIGGQYHLKLPDGTSVWLNAATSIKYPARFSGNERRVELNGEAYFEVTHSVAASGARQSFVVESNGVTTEVLGTHFNVMSYANEAAKEITLLEGIVRVSIKDNSTELSPAMQAIIKGETITNKSEIDTGEVVGWKSGYFVFHDAPIESIMRQVERWYGAHVVYQGDVNQLFNASILRSEPLSRLLHLLELNGYVHFKTENKTIYVLP